MTDQSLLEDFADETREHLDALESSLLRLESDSKDRELLDTIFRSMHTIKGASEYLGFERMARLSHRLENLLDLFREGSLKVDKVAVDLLIDARDRMGELIAQVEASGEETAAIDDLLERVAAASAGFSAADGVGEAGTVYADEADAELFAIFMEQLTGGIRRLLDTAGRMAAMTDVAEGAAEMVDQVDRLTASANYMGYDALAAVYEEMLGGLASFAQELERADAAQVADFLQATVVAGVARIKQLFPHADALAAIEPTLGPAAVHDDPPIPEDGLADADAPVLGDDLEPVPQAPSDIAALLSDLPGIDVDQREALLAQSLDIAFPAVGRDATPAGGAEDTDADEDPIAEQFSTSPDAMDADPVRLSREAERRASLSILDDFGAPATDIDATTADGSAVDGDAAGTERRDGDVDLWPRAPAVDPPAPENVSSEAAAPVPRLDLNGVPADDASDEDVPADKAASRPRGAVRQSIRVDADKVDALMNQVGELVVNRSSFVQLFLEMRELTHSLSRRLPMDQSDLRLIADLTGRLNDATTALGRVSSELQEQVMQVRMLPISRLFNRYPRLVHDLLRNSEKKIQLQFRGEETELDRVVIEQLADPMVHIIRNAVDHGIETGEARKRKGKPEKGVLVLEAYHEGSNVVIEVTDDGQGVDLSRIRRKAIEKGIATRETLEKMEHRSLIDMIMLPGFSTAETVTHTSGRGVGMDVVKRNIESINGTLAIETRQDVGTRIRIKIPLTLAIIPALMVRCRGSHFTVPLSAVQETLRIDQGEIFTVDGSEVMHWHEEPLPLVRLTDLLHMDPPPDDAPGGRLFVVVVKSASGRIGFIVDAFLGRQEVVIKPLEDYLQENSGFSGATILGDGAISLILNVDELVVLAKAREAERKLTAAVL